MNSLTREQRIYGAAGACDPLHHQPVLQLVRRRTSAASRSTISGQDVVPSWWILLIFAAVAAVVLIADAMNYELPADRPARPRGPPTSRASASS